MNKSVMKFLSACIIASSTFVSASAFDIKDLLNQAGQALETAVSQTSLKVCFLHQTSK